VSAVTINYQNHFLPPEIRYYDNIIDTALWPHTSPKYVHWYLLTDYRLIPVTDWTPWKRNATPPNAAPTCVTAAGAAHWLWVKHASGGHWWNYVARHRQTNFLLSYNTPPPPPPAIMAIKIANFEIITNQLNTLIRQYYLTLHFLRHIFPEIKTFCKIIRYIYCLTHVFSCFVILIQCTEDAEY
jgi:hypothetical protein